MKVKITKANKPTYWYANMIGREFLVKKEAYDPESYETTVNQSRQIAKELSDKSSDISGYCIDKTDCEIVK